MDFQCSREQEQRNLVSRKIPSRQSELPTRDSPNKGREYIVLHCLTICNIYDEFGVSERWPGMASSIFSFNIQQPKTFSPGSTTLVSVFLFDSHSDDAHPPQLSLLASP